MNLLFKSLRSDVVDRRIKAFVKRILQVYSPQPPHIVCGVLILLSQILKDKSGIVQKSFKGEVSWLDDEEERFVDIPDPDDVASDLKEGQEKPVDEADKVNSGNKGLANGDAQPITGKSGHASHVGNKAQGSWVHRNNFGGPGRWSEYDPYGRNPLFARAELECIWELQHLVNHYHPTVKLYATSLLKGQPIEYDGDPVKDFTLSRFLDRFVYKNPKKNLDQNNASISRFRKPGPTGIRAVPVNSKEYLEAGEDGVPVDEKFFYRYFSERASKIPDDVSDGGSVSDDEFDAFLDDFEKSADNDGNEDLDLDFASDKKTKKQSKHKEESEESEDYDDDEDDDLDLADDDLAAEFEQEMEDEDDGNTVDGGEPSPDEDDELQMLMLGGGGGGKKRKKPSGDGDGDDDLDTSYNDRKYKKKSKKDDMTNLFASAEEFAHLLEEDTEISQGGSADMRNKEKAAQRQLEWESDRDRWLQDKKGRSSKPKVKSGKGGNKKFSNSKPHQKHVGGKKFKSKTGNKKLKRKR